MALFQKKPIVGTAAPIYTLGLQKTVLIVGLGNIGKQFTGTRHNIGFACIDALAISQVIDNWTEKKDLKSLVASDTVGDTRVILCKPTTLMNNSGEAVQAVAHFYKIHGQSIVAVYDELDLDFGQIRLRYGGSAAGHNGVKSVIQHIGEDFGRVRIGIGPKTPEKMDGANFVLAPFGESEQAQLPNLLKETTAVLTEFIHSGQLPSDTRTFLV
ncbi:MAG TPA: aminoacyl-tRNA hydrolase [Candidatus Limnocylindrales bacterium]|nr:aminoacyl-tRNA hydrolase [Candidatus Limnocylindrales bacterium]